MASKFDKDFLAFFDEGYNLEIGSPESSAPLLKALGSISSISLRALEFPKKKNLFVSFSLVFQTERVNDKKEESTWT